MKSRRVSVLLIALLLSLLLASQVIPVQAGHQAGTTMASLSQAEIDSLLYMREEEKLAHDVYVVLYNTWRQGVFSNISSSETNHMAAVKTLLDRYGIADPAKGNGLGVFKNAFLQSLYNTLIARGKTSLSEAFKVGGAIEEIDILDLERYMAEVSHDDIIQTYNHLKSGSYMHLRAFVSNLQSKTGEVYVPQYMTQEEYQAIIGGSNGGGGGGGGGGCRRCG